MDFEILYRWVNSRKTWLTRCSYVFLALTHRYVYLEWFIFNRNKLYLPWWRHDMKNDFRITSPLWGESHWWPVDLPHREPVERWYLFCSWWRNQVETFSALLALCAGDLPVNSPHKGQWRGAFGVFFDLHLNKRLSKQSWGWWFETSLWRHCKVLLSFWLLLVWEACWTNSLVAVMCTSDVMRHYVHMMALQWPQHLPAPQRVYRFIEAWFFVYQEPGCWNQNYAWNHFSCASVYTFLIQQFGDCDG